jgi:N-glycosylase/DNA lyase
MDEIINKINSLKQSEISNIVDNRIKEFKELNKKSDEELFKELCFCILTANFNAEKTIKIQEAIGGYFLTDSEEVLAKKLRDLGHRYPNTRARYVAESSRCKDSIMKVLQSSQGNNLRDWIVDNVKGLGYKEASHFLRNIGFDDFAIIDFHIIDLLVGYGLIKRPKSLTRKKYLEIEKLLRVIGRKTGLTLAELDLYLWYLETGKILK